MKRKRKQKPVILLELDSGVTQEKYKKIIWLLFLEAIFTIGMLAGLKATWGSVTPTASGMMISAVVSIVFCVLSEILKDKIRFSRAMMLVPWPVFLLAVGVGKCWIGARAWINVLIGRWNMVNEGGAALFAVQAGEADIRAFTMVAILALTEIMWLFIVGYHMVLANLLVITWLLIQLLCAISDPVACGFLIAGLGGMWITGKNLKTTRRGIVWTIGILAAFIILGNIVSSEKIEAVDLVRENVQERVHELRYGEDTLPEGDLYRADELQSDGSEMLKVRSEQQKNMYLRGFVGAVYNNGVWEPLADSAFGGDYTGMMKWLREKGFDPLTQVSAYYQNCNEEEKPEKNQLDIKVTGASRYYVYTPASLEHAVKGMTEEKDFRLMSRGLIGKDSYTMDELSGSRPAELTVTADWISNPTTDEQKEYLKAEAVYREFVYDTYRTVDTKTAELMKKMFWEDYQTDSDGIYSAVCQIRKVLKDTVEYTETPEKTPDGEDPVEYFLTESRKGNSMLYASIAVDALRVHGIPARYVEGYYVSSSDMKEDNTDQTSLTGRDAHAWVEVYFDGIGWLPLDVSPGYYFDAVTLQKMVSSPDNVQKNAVLKNDSQSSEQVTGLENGMQRKIRDKIVPAVRNVTAVILGVIAVVMILLVFSIAVAELLRIVLMRKEQKNEKNMTQKVRVLRNEKKLYTYLALLGIHARLGWNTAETDRILTERFKELEEGEYIRVCDLIEKVIYGDIELEPYEERTLDSFLHKILSDTKVLNWKIRLKRRYIYVWKCRK